MEDALSAPCLSIKQHGPSWLEERLGKANRNTKVRTAKTVDHRECHANHFTIAIDERSAGAAGSGLRIEHNLARKNATARALRTTGTGEFPPAKRVERLLRHSAGGL